MNTKANLMASAADTSKIGQAEDVDTTARDADAGGGDELGLSAAEQAQFDAMQAGKGAPSEIDHDATVTGDDGVGDGVDGGDGDGDGEAGAVVDGAAADGAVDSAVAGADAQRPPKTISYGKYQRELGKVQKRADDLEARLNGAVQETAKEREARVRLDERTKQLLEAIQARRAAPDAVAAAAAADPEPDKESDPIGHLEWRNRKLEKTVEGLTSGRQQEQQQTAEQREEANVYRLFEADLSREAAADPAFADAFVHLRETRYRELGFIYADIDINDPAQCAQLTAQDQVRLSDNIQRSFYNEQVLVARQALQAGKSPAKVVANLARARGFTPKAAPDAAAVAAAAATAAVPAKPGNGAAAPARQAAPATNGSIVDQLQAIREGQESARSLSDAGGSPGGAITPDRLANMTDDEFLQFYEKMPKGRFDQLMGKPS